MDEYRIATEESLDRLGEYLKRTVRAVPTIPDTPAEHTDR
jgi:hypothetical protein